MVSETKETWRKLFMTKSHCDYCGNPKRVILRVIIMPIFDIENKICGVVMAKKCKKCCKDADF